MNTFLLVAINAKYIHSNLAVYSLRAYARERGHQVELAEYTINQQKEEVLRDIYQRKPMVVGFSCYIWNMEYVRELAEDLHRVMPELPIWFGGPEVTWNPEDRMEEMTWLTGVMLGEGEETLAELSGWYERQQEIPDDDYNWNIEKKRIEQICIDDRMIGQRAGNDTGDSNDTLAGIAGLCIRTEQGKVVRTAVRPLLSMDALVFPYQNLAEYENRIIYYESSRGCPFSCSYCLSSVEKKLRFRSLSMVFQELSCFLDCKVPQVKFVDRTFNCRHEHAWAIWQYIHAHDNGITNFHFEVAADLLREEDFLLFEQMRPGLIQLEIGVQTTNPDTIHAIGRKMDLEKVAHFTERVRRGRNIHQHLDLIAGLPEEGLESFARSFNEVYDMKPDQLQLGFLKVLHGTRMEQEAAQHGLIYHSRPTYEVLATKWLSYEELLILKNVEETVEDYYNTGQFASVLAYAIPYFESSFAFYREFGHFLREQGYRDSSQNRASRYLALRAFLQQKDMDLSLVDELLTFDYCLREKLKQVPVFVPDQEPYKKLISDFFAEEIRTGQWMKLEEELSYRQLRGRCEAVVLQRNTIQFCNTNEMKIKQICDKMESNLWLAIFDYGRRNVMNHNARVTWVPVESALVME